MGTLRRLLVTGGSGFLGWHVAQAARPLWDVTATFRTHAVDSPGVRQVQVDLTVSMELRHIFSSVHPDAVIHAAACSDINFCQTHQAETDRINRQAAVELAGLCANREIPFVFTSSDLVFDGERAPYREEDSVSPLNVYGEGKARAEREIFERWPRAIVCRLPPMFGPPAPGGSGFLGPMLEAIRSHVPLRLFVDEFRTPVSVRAAAEGLLLALEKAKGLLHLGGPDRISRFDFGRLLVEALGGPANLLVPVSQRDVPQKAPRPRDVSLDSSRARGLGFVHAPLREALTDLARELKG